MNRFLDIMFICVDAMEKINNDENKVTSAYLEAIRVALVGLREIYYPVKEKVAQ